MLILLLLNLILSPNNNVNMPAITRTASEVRFSDTSQISLGVKTSATNTIVVDAKNRKKLFGKNEYEQRPIASISKLMTAIVFLENNQGWDNIVEMQATDEVGGSRLKLAKGESLSVRDLFNASLIASSNNGIMALVRSTGLGQEEFVKRMNEKAKDLKMYQTVFIEPTGMNAQNVSTAYDLTLLVTEAFSKSEIVEASHLPTYNFKTKFGRNLLVYNTDVLLSSFLNKDEYEIIGAKTGFLEESGYCLASMIKSTDKEIITIVLNSSTIEDRFLDTKGLAYWALNK